jgi:hypothetical protein
MGIEYVCDLPKGFFTDKIMKSKHFSSYSYIWSYNTAIFKLQTV